MLLAFPIITLMSLCNGLLWGVGHVRFWLGVFCVAAVVDVALDFLLIPGARRGRRGLGEQRRAGFRRRSSSSATRSRSSVRSSGTRPCCCAAAVAPRRCRRRRLGLCRRRRRRARDRRRRRRRPRRVRRAVSTAAHTFPPSTRPGSSTPCTAGSPASVATILASAAAAADGPDRRSRPRPAVRRALNRGRDPRRLRQPTHRSDPAPDPELGRCVHLRTRRRARRPRRPDRLRSPQRAVRHGGRTRDARRDAFPLPRRALAPTARSSATTTDSHRGSGRSTTG